MSRLVDPTICPDCRAPLDTAAGCTGCGLRIEGPLAAELWSAMVAADGIVERLRLGAAPQVSTAAPAGKPDPRPTPQAPPLTARPPRTKRRLPATSVPVVLLSLGALCLMVAAIVFVAVTWSALGLTGRTLVLLGFTGLLAAVAVVLTRRGLRGAAETFWLIVAGMLTIDLLAAESAGLAGLDALTWRGTGGLVGGALLAMGTGVALWARSQPVQRLHGAHAVAVAGALVVVLTNGWLASNPAVGSSVALIALASVAAALARPLPVVATGVGALVVLTWLVVLGHGLARADEASQLVAWWSEARGWPLLVAALAAASATLARRVPTSARIVLAAAALLPVVVLVNAPATAGTETLDHLLRAATLAALALVTAFAPTLWSRAATVWVTLGALGLGGHLLLMPWTSVAALSPAIGLDDRMPALGYGAAAWSYLPVTASVLLAAWAVARLLPELLTVDVRTVRNGLLVLGSGGAALGVWTTLLGARPPLWLGIVAGSVAAAVVAGATWMLRRPAVPGAPPAAALLGSLATGYLAVTTLGTASPSWLASALVASTMALALVLAFAVLEGSDEPVAAASVLVLAGLAGWYALAAWGHVFEADAATQALALAGYATLLGLGAAPVTRRPLSRVALELTAVVVAVAAVVISPDGEATAMVLTVIGSAVAVLAVTNRDREQAGWAGAAVLGAATVLRVDLGVPAPEAYTLPAALVLVGAGLWRLHVDAEARSLSALGSGLTLALLPSLLLALDEPVTLRGALIGAGGVLVLAFGAQRRLASPLLLGAATTALLAVRHLEPYANALPRWISLGALGLALLVVGITWESRLRNVRTAQRYLAGLR